MLWEVRPVDSLLPWTFSVTGVPGTITSIRVFPITSAEGAPLDAGGELMRIDSSADDPTPGVLTDVALSRPATSSASPAASRSVASH